MINIKQLFCCSECLLKNLTCSDKISINNNDQRIIYNQKKLKQIQLSHFHNIQEKFKLQYDFYLISLIDDSGLPIQLKIIIYKKLVQIDDEINVFIKEINQFHQQLELDKKKHEQRINNLLIKQKYIQNMLDQFQANKLMRISNQIIPYNDMLSEKDIEYQILFKNILTDFIIKRQESIKDSNKNFISNLEFQNYLNTILEKYNSCFPPQVIAGLQEKQNCSEKNNYNQTIQLKEDYSQNQKAFILEKQSQIEAIQFYDKDNQQNSTDDNSYYNEGLLLQKQGRLDEALLDYDKAIKQNPYYDNTLNKKGYNYKILGLVYKKLGRYEEAIECYDKAIQLNPKNDTSYNHKGAILRKQGRIEEAMKLYEQAFLINPNNDNTYIQKGLALVQQGRAFEAMELFDISISLNSNNFKAYNHKASILRVLGKYDEAIKLYDQAILINPKNNCTYRQKAFLLAQLNMFDESLKFYDKAIILNEFDYKSYIKKAMILQKMGDFKGSEENLQKYQNLIPAYKSIKNKIVKKNESEQQFISKSDENGKVIIPLQEGVFLQQEGKYEEAILKFKEQLQIDPKDRISIIYLGQCLQDLGRRDEASQLYKRFIAQNS